LWWRHWSFAPLSNAKKRNSKLRISRHASQDGMPQFQVLFEPGIASANDCFRFGQSRVPKQCHANYKAETFDEQIAGQEIGSQKWQNQTECQQ
jgi:hypothetical protein